jgi:hypothetical protein
MINLSLFFNIQVKQWAGQPSFWSTFQAGAVLTDVIYSCSPSRERIFTFHKCWTIPQSSHRKKWPRTLISRNTAKFVKGKDIGKFIRFKLFIWFPLVDHFNLKGLLLLSNPREKVNIMYWKSLLKSK